MLNKDEIIKCIFQGWLNVSEFIIDTQDEENKYHFQPEYLVTVKIADCIRDYFNTNHIMDKYSILMEEKTAKVFTRREKEIKEYYPSGGPKQYRREKESERKGRLDIVIYEKNYHSVLDSYRTICAIEIKNYYGYYKVIEKDIVRLLELKSNYVESNSFQFGIMTFIIKPNKKDWESVVEENIDILQKYIFQISQNLLIKEESVIKTKVIHKRYHDEECPKLKYVFIVAIIII